MSRLSPPNLLVNGRVTRPRTDSASTGAFVWESGGTTFNGTFDPVSYFGYNIASPGVQINTAEPYAGYVIEADYNDGSKHTVEMYAEYNDITDALSFRPWFFQIDRSQTTAAAALTSAVILGNPLNVNHPDGSNLAQIDKNLSFFAAQSGSDNTLGVRAASGRTAQLAVGSGDGPTNQAFKIQSSGTARKRVNFISNDGTTDTTVMRAGGDLNGGTGGYLAIGNVSLDNTAAFCVTNGGPDNAKTAKFVPKSTQTAGHVQFYDTSNAIAFEVTLAGLPKWTLAGNQQTTVGAAGGASALPATPTKYMKIVDSAGTTLVVPAYAAS